eukprot:TRINITY_DN96334_c0_g1_i1.p1 TRINITY_DN96334_c0_g1~~TRINITY_DN96334_c0_g1_i1.p1  ORF type:complete len:1047 (-),score=178.29 TRINITY_DN96334_c0_g1_i1:21-3161(-)
MSHRRLPAWNRAWKNCCICLLLVEIVSAQTSPAVSLQNPEGQDLIFLRLAVSTALFGPFGFVENEMVFQNPEDRRMEGRFSFALPVSEAGVAMPSRFAMEIQGRLMEGEVVNRSKAQRVYREILHEARDPALLEQSQGNIFTARVFPIEPRARVRLILSYAVLAPKRDNLRTLALPLAGLPKVYNFTFSAVVGSLGSTTFDTNCSLPSIGQVLGRRDGSTGNVHFSASFPEPLVPIADAVLEVKEVDQASSVFSVDGGQLVSTFVVGKETGLQSVQQQFAPSTWIVYIDTSASTADSTLVRLPLIGALLEAMPSCDVQVFAFDIEVVELRALGPKYTSFGSAVQVALQERLPLGATDLELLLEHVESRVQGTSETMGILILSDMIATANERAAMKLGQLLRPNGNRVVEIGVIGTKFDSSAGGAIAASGDGRIVRIPLTSKNLPTVAAQAWADITRPLGSRGTPKAASGWVWPLAASDLQDGDELIVFSGAGTGLSLSAPELHLSSKNTSFTIAPGPVQAAAAAFSALLSREAVRARLELLESQRQLAQSASAAKATEYEMVLLSETHRVMCPHTALLVLETDADYVRFSIPQDKLSPVLVVTDEGVKLSPRKDLVLLALPDPISVESTTTSETPESTTSLVNISSACNSTLFVCPEPVEESIFLTDEPQTLDEADFAPDVMASMRSESSGGASRGSSPRLHLLLVLLLILCAGGQDWANIEGDAEDVLKNQPSPPKERLRETAMRYAGALWTKRRASELRSFCAQWIVWDPTNGLAYEYMSKAAQHLGQGSTALRAATSIAEVAPRDAEQLLRGAWLALSLDVPGASTWALRFAQRSLEERNDNPNVYRALAMAAWREGDYKAAADAYAAGIETDFHGRYGDVRRVLREEAALFLRSLQAAKQTALVQEFSKRQLRAVNLDEGKDLGILITLSWLTDANDVDLHVLDPAGGECFFSKRSTAWGLQLYSDQTQGLGPEVVALKGRKAGTYKVGVKYFSAGAMGASRGTVVVRQMSGGIPWGEPEVIVFTLPAGYASVLPVATFTVE